MAFFRIVAVNTWADPYVESLTPVEKLLHVYMFTNERISNIGHMEASLRRISFETGVDEEAVERFLQKMEDNGKLVRDGCHLLLVNFIRHQHQAGMISSGRTRVNLQTLYIDLQSEKLKQALEKFYPYIFAEDQIVPKLKNGRRKACHEKGRAPKAAAAQAAQSKAQEAPPKACPPPPSPSPARPSRMNEEDIEEAKADVRRLEKKGRYEFGLLRQAYDEKLKEGMYTGWEEFNRLYNSPEWPGIDELLCSVRRLQENDVQWTSGHVPSLKRFLNEGMWTLEPRKAPASQQDAAQQRPALSPEGERVYQLFKQQIPQR